MCESRIKPDTAGHFPKLIVGPLRTFFGPVALGNGTVWQVAVMRTRNGLMLSAMGIGAAQFEGPCSPDEVQALLKCAHDDAKNFSDLVADQFCHALTGRAGTYPPEHCDASPAGPDTYLDDD